MGQKNLEKSTFDLNLLSRHELEFYWLAEIYVFPEECRKHGLMGLDSSMFINKNYFELGLMMLRDHGLCDRNIIKPVVPDQILEKMIEQVLVAKLERAADKMIFHICRYQEKCRLIEHYGSDAF